jgi:hypothetical protein
VLVKSGTTSVGVDRGVVLAGSADKKVHLFRERGAPRVVRVGGLVDAAVRWKDGLVVAYQRKSFELVSGRSRARAPLALEGTPGERVQLMRLGPKDTLVVGFANGMVGIWDLTTRRLLDRVRLHGWPSTAARCCARCGARSPWSGRTASLSSARRPGIIFVRRGEVRGGAQK